MSRLLVYLGRFALFVLGFVGAALAASAFVHLLLFAGLDVPHGEARELTVAALLVSVPVVAAWMANAVFAPAFLIFVLSEIAGWRSWTTHALLGAAAAAAVLVAASVHGSPAFTGFDAVLLASGIVGGSAYWAITGRSAGLWLRGAAPEDAAAGDR